MINVVIFDSLLW